MPCDSVITVELNDLSFNTTVLAKALQATGYKHVSVSASDGTVRFTSPDYMTSGVHDKSGLRLTTAERDATPAVNAIKRAYSLESVRQAATRFGWQQPSQVKGKPNTYKVQQKLTWGK